MDPVSAVASLLTVLATAQKSASLLHSFFRDVTLAPANVRRGIALLGALHQIFRDFASLCANNVLPLDTVLWLRPCLEACVDDFNDMLPRIRKADRNLKCGKLRRTWTRLCWVTAPESRLEKFFARVQFYGMLFQHASSPLKTLEALDRKLIAFNDFQATDKHTKPVSENSISTMNPLQESVAPAAAVPAALVPASISANPSFGQPTPSEGSLSFLDDTAPNAKDSSNSSSDNFELPHRSTRSIQERASGVLTNPIVTLRYWVGSVSSSSSTQGLLDETAASIVSRGFACGLSVRFLWGMLSQINFTIHAQQDQSIYNRISLKHELFHQPIVPYDAEIFDLVRDGQIEAMDALVAKGKASYADILPDGSSLLHTAVRCNSFEAAKCLVSRGVDVNASDDDGQYVALGIHTLDQLTSIRTPLHLALSCARDYSIPRLLLVQGGDLCNQSVGGQTPLHSLFNDNIRQVITAHQPYIDLSAKDVYGMTPVHYLSWSSKTTSADIQPLLASHHPLNLRDGHGRTVLHYAAQRGNSDLLEHYLRLDLRISVDGPDADGKTPMHYAVESRRTDAISILHRHGGDLWARDNAGNTPLHAAARRGNVEATKRIVLLGGSARLSIRNHAGQTPSELSNKFGRTEVQSFLQSLGQIQGGVPPVITPVEKQTTFAVD